MFNIFKKQPAQITESRVQSVADKSSFAVFTQLAARIHSHHESLTSNFAKENRILKEKIALLEKYLGIVYVEEQVKGYRPVVVAPQKKVKTLVKKTATKKRK